MTLSGFDAKVRELSAQRDAIGRLLVMIETDGVIELDAYEVSSLRMLHLQLGHKVFQMTGSRTVRTPGRTDNKEAVK